MVDRCNARKVDRERILQLCFYPPKEKVLCVYFSTGKDECMRRVARRLDHPTVPFGRGRRVVESFVNRGVEAPNAGDE